MCLMLPALVVSVAPDTCVIAGPGPHRTVSTLMAPEVRPGDWVVIAGGTVLKRVSPEQAQAMSRALRLATHEESVS